MRVHGAMSCKSEWWRIVPSYPLPHPLETVGYPSQQPRSLVVGELTVAVLVAVVILVPQQHGLQSQTLKEKNAFHMS